MATRRLTEKQRELICDLMLEVLRSQPVDDNAEVYADSFGLADLGLELLAAHIGVTDWHLRRLAVETELKRGHGKG